MHRGLFLTASIAVLLVGCGSNVPSSLSSSQNVPSAVSSAPAQRQVTRLPTSTPQIAASPSIPPAPSQAIPIGNDDAFRLLWTIDGKVLSAQEIEACLQAGPCITEHAPESPQAQAIARLYQLVPDQDHAVSPVFIRLERGDRIALSGYGTTWLAHLQIAGFDTSRYYWAINPCTTNTRLLIDARTGEPAGPAHEFVICTPMEPPMPFNTQSLWSDRHYQ